MSFFEKDKLSALEAKENAQWITFAPFVFQATRVLRDTGILKAVEESKDGFRLDEIAAAVKLPLYGVRVLAEAALGIGLLVRAAGVYKITKTSYFILHDELTIANMDFTHDVCYNGLFHLDKSIANSKPEGLKVFGDWNTIYEALSTTLPESVKKSWFAFDHFYSDQAFPDVLPLVFANSPKTLLDIGGNTGKWTTSCLDYNPDVKITIMDLPDYSNLVQSEIDARGFSNRFKFHGANILDETRKFPQGFDAIWMSQFLDCFSDEQIVSILKRARAALNPGGAIYILETFWDLQRFEVSAFSLQQTSLYFTAMANGNSQMYDSVVFFKLIAEAGLKITEQKDLIGVSHTMLICQPDDHA